MATYEDVKNIPNNPSAYLIDVRQKEELEKGVLPASINIPLGELEAALKMPDDSFKQSFERTKPSKDSPIIFSCFAGTRAQRAADLAKSLGFENAKPYKGSWQEWAKKENL